MNTLAELVELLVDSGISAEFRKRAIELADKLASERVEFHMISMEIPRNSAETTEERRRRKDRERKRKPVENSTESVETPLILTSFSSEVKKLTDHFIEDLDA